MKQKILIVSFSPIARDPRVMRQIRLLEHDYDITVAGFGPAPAAHVRFVDVTPAATPLVERILRGAKLLLGCFESYYWKRGQVIRLIESCHKKSFDLVIANDLSALPVSLKVASGAPVFMDAHEYSPREDEDRLSWRLLFGRLNHALCQRYLRQAAAMMTVSEGIAAEYRRCYGVSPGVVYNAPEDQKLQPSANVPDRIRLVHHGVAVRSRRLEVMIDAVKSLDQRFTLDFMLADSDLIYMNELRQRAQGDERIRFLPPVPMPDICKTLNAYDVGVYVLPPLNFNQEYALPNKFFEFVQARLAVAVGPSPEMARIATDRKLGVVATGFDAPALARALATLDPAQVQQFKAASDMAARELNYSSGAQFILNEIQHLLAGPNRNLQP